MALGVVQLGRDCILLAFACMKRDSYSTSVTVSIS